MTLKWGILSTANIALTQFIPAILRARNSELVAIASRGPKVHAVAEQLGVVRAYETYEELLTDAEVDAVYIPLPNNLHAEWVVKAAQAGKHIICEKPIALTQEQFVQMQQACEKHRVFLMEAFMYQFHPQHQFVKQLISNGEIGEVKLYQSSHSFMLEDRKTNIRMDASKGGGAIWDVGCYSLHALQNLVGRQVETLYATSLFDENSGVDLTSSIIATLENGVQAVIDCSFDMCDRNEVTIVGTKGSVKIEQAFRPDRAGHIGRIVITAGNEQRTVLLDGDIYRAEIEFFEQVIAGNESLQQQHHLSFQNIALINAAYASANSKQVVSLKDLQAYGEG
ncbi:MAG: Gfo/Idh/MocA family oxidoreductase [Lysinibacillus sp.]